MKLLPTFTTTPEPGNVYHVDALTLLKALPDASVSLIATDPPYNGVKDDAWDNQWQSDRDFLDWLRVHLIEMRRVLKPNGSLYLFASPQMAARVEVLIGEYFNVLNQVVWMKPNGNANWRADKEAIRMFLPNTERVIFAEQFASDGRYATLEYELNGYVFKPLKDWFRERVTTFNIGLGQLNTALGAATNGGGLASGYFGSKVEFQLPTSERYKQMQSAFPDAFNREYEDLRREYEDLRREYEDLRRPFNSSPYAPYTDVWTFRTVQAYPGKHPTEKPLELMRHIVKMSSRPGGLVLDPFAGSGTTLDAARQEGRKFIGGDITLEYVDMARRRLAQPYTVNMFETLSAAGAS